MLTRSSSAPCPELSARIAALLKGEVDLITKIPPDQMDRVAKASNTKIEGVLYGGLYCLSVVSQKPPLDSKPFRQAMSLAIDRETIVKELWRGQGAVPNSIVVKGDNHYDPSLPPLPYDPNRAKQLLKEANYKGEELVIETGVGFTVLDREMGEVIVAMWKDVGINAKLELIEYSVYLQKIREKSFKGLRWTDPTSAYNDPDGMMWRHLAPGGPNAYWFRNPRFDELGNAARFSVDEKLRGRGLPGDGPARTGVFAPDPHSPAHGAVRAPEVCGLEAVREPDDGVSALQPEVHPRVIPRRGALGHRAPSREGDGARWFLSRGRWSAPRCPCRAFLGS